MCPWNKLYFSSLNDFIFPRFITLFHYYIGSIHPPCAFLCRKSKITDLITNILINLAVKNKRARISTVACSVYYLIIWDLQGYFWSRGGGGLFSWGILFRLLLVPDTWTALKDIISRFFFFHSGNGLFCCGEGEVKYFLDLFVRDTCTRIKALFLFLFLQSNKRWRGVWIFFLRGEGYFRVQSSFLGVVGGGGRG